MDGTRSGMTLIEVILATAILGICTFSLIETDPEEDLPVSPDSGLFEGWTFERTVDDYESEDGLYVVRTRVVKGSGGAGMEQEYVRLIYYRD